MAILLAYASGYDSHCFSYQSGAAQRISSDQVARCQFSGPPTRGEALGELSATDSAAAEPPVNRATHSASCTV
jgi:hypothetical protein